jgi:DNA-binding PadR family transcriptional regulator
MYERKLLMGFIRAHILHHANDPDGIYGSWMIEELGEHGYKVSPGTLYPILHEMEKDETLEVQDILVDGKIRKIYRTTKKGEEVLLMMKKFIRELSEEVLE